MRYRILVADDLAEAGLQLLREETLQGDTWFVYSVEPKP